jgi:hypothetical protein
MDPKTTAVPIPLPGYSPICINCRHIRDIGKRRCAAFDTEIPAAIWSGENDHTRPVEGDHGIVFEDAR